MNSTAPPTWDIISAHLQARSAALWRLPDADFDVDPIEPSLGIRIPDQGQPLPDVTGYRHLTSRRVYVDGEVRLELRVAGTMVLADGFRLLSDIAAELKTGRLGFAEAVATGLGRLQELLHRRNGMPMDREIGLWGELHVLQSAAVALGAQKALAAWRGPDRAEHDFTLDLDDLEVKTTSAELRHHRIVTLTQLQPLPDRPLWLLSVRITRSQGPGSRTLAEQLSQTRALLGDLAHHLDDRLTDLHLPTDDGWEAGWRLRALPDLYTVDATFPGLTADSLARAGIDTSGLLKVEQTIDLENRPTSAGPAWLTPLATEKDC